MLLTLGQTSRWKTWSESKLMKITKHDLTDVFVLTFNWYSTWIHQKWLIKLWDRNQGLYFEFWSWTRQKTFENHCPELTINQMRSSQGILKVRAATLACVSLFLLCALVSFRTRTRPLKHSWVHLAFMYEEWARKPVPGTPTHHILYTYSTDRILLTP